MRKPTYAELRKFVERERWVDKDAKSRKKKGDHHRCTLRLPTGEVLYTRISHGRGEIADDGLWAAILRNELKVTEKEFWACVDDKVLPSRPQPAPPERRGPALDAKLARNLVRRAGLAQGVVAKMTRDEAVAAWQRYLTERARRPPADQDS